MCKKNLKEFLNIQEDIEEKDLSLDECGKIEVKENKARIKKLFDVALSNKYIVYFDGRHVPDLSDEDFFFNSIKEEFYYNNDLSYLVFVDNTNFKVRFKIRYLKKYDYDIVYNIVEKACKYTKEHPEVSEYKLY